MGITIHFRGTIDDMVQVEEFEDCILDAAYALGGRGKLWRSYANHDPNRIVRGLILQIRPGQDTTSLLLSPEGQLIGLMQIKEAENAVLKEAPWCFVKTQFGSIDGHAAIVELLSMMKQRWFSDLEVSDESGYWDHRDPVRLAEQLAVLRAAIHEIADAATHSGLSPEAAEDPEILISRIERVAALVAQKFRGISEQNAPSAGGDAQKAALEDDPAVAGSSDSSMKQSNETAAKEPWELETSLWQFDPSQSAMDFNDEPERPDNSEIVKNAKSLWLHVTLQAPVPYSGSGFFSIAQQGLLDVHGGLHQATSSPHHNDDQHRQHAIAQLKRALKGAGFARGAIFGLHSGDQIDKATSDRWHDRLNQIVDQIQQLLSDAWCKTGDSQ